MVSVLYGRTETTSDACIAWQWALVASQRHSMVGTVSSVATNAVRTHSMPHASKEVLTMGAPPTSSCLTSSSWEGQTSSSPTFTQTSMEGPNGHGVMSPRGSTCASLGKPHRPMPVQLRWVMLHSSQKWPCGVNESDDGVLCFTSHQGRTQPSICCSANGVYMNPDHMSAPRANSSVGRLLAADPESFMNDSKFRTALSGMPYFLDAPPRAASLIFDLIQPASPPRTGSALMLPPAVVPGAPGRRCPVACRMYYIEKKPEESCSL